MTIFKRSTVYLLLFCFALILSSCQNAKEAETGEGAIEDPLEVVNEETKDISVMEQADNSFTRIFTDKIFEDILMEFELHGEVENNVYYTKEIIIKDYETGNIIQQINDLEVWSSDGEGLSFVIEDINFDGYKDIRIAVHGGAPNIPCECWIYNHNDKLFVYNKDFSSIMNLIVEEENQVLRSPQRGSAVHHTVTYYKMIDDQITEFKWIDMGVSNEENSEELLDITYEFIDGEWIETDRRPTSLKG